MVRMRQLVHGRRPDRSIHPSVIQAGMEKIKEVKDEANALDNSIQYGTPDNRGSLVPIGGGFYATPNTPADPTDCARWPSSPYCGGGGIIPGDFMDIPLQLDPQVRVNECEVCVTLTPRFLVDLAPYTICYRNPDCRINPPPRLPPIPLPRDDDDQPRIRRCRGGYWKFCQFPNNYPPWGYKDTANSPDDIEVYNQNVKQGFIELNRQYEARLQRLYELLNELIAQGNYCRVRDVNQEYWDSLNVQCYFFNNDGTWTRDSRRLRAWRPPTVLDKRLEVLLPGYNGEMFWFFVYNAPLYIYKPFSKPFPECPPGYEIPESPPPQPPPPPPPSLPPDPVPPMCCNPQNDQLLKLIAKRLGTGRFPYPVPKLIVSGKGNETIQLEDVPDFFAWLTHQIDALIGDFPIEIKVPDLNPTEAGDQQKTFKLPNIAETLAELFALALNGSINSETLINIGMRNLAETAAAKTAAIITQDVALNNAEYLGYENKQIEKKIPVAFTPGKERLDEILQESEQKIISYDYPGKDDLQDVLLELRNAAAIIRTAMWRKLEPGGDMKQQILDLLKKGIDFAERGVNPESRREDGEFSKFVSEVETGFMTRDGLSDPTNPYGRHYTQRPKIKVLGDSSDSSPGSEGQGGE